MVFVRSIGSVDIIESFGKYFISTPTLHVGESPIASTRDVVENANNPRPDNARVSYIEPDGVGTSLDEFERGEQGLIVCHPLDDSGCMDLWSRLLMSARSTKHRVVILLCMPLEVAMSQAAYLAREHMSRARDIFYMTGSYAVLNHDCTVWVDTDKRSPCVSSTSGTTITVVPCANDDSDSDGELVMVDDDDCVTCGSVVGRDDGRSEVDTDVTVDRDNSRPAPSVVEGGGIAVQSDDSVTPSDIGVDWYNCLDGFTDDHYRMSKRTFAVVYTGRKLLLSDFLSVIINLFGFDTRYLISYVTRGARDIYGCYICCRLAPRRTNTSNMTIPGTCMRHVRGAIGVAWLASLASDVCWTNAECITRNKKLAMLSELALNEEAMSVLAKPRECAMSKLSVRTKRSLAHDDSSVADCSRTKRRTDVPRTGLDLPTVDHTRPEDTSPVSDCVVCERVGRVSFRFLTKLDVDTLLGLYGIRDNIIGVYQQLVTDFILEHCVARCKTILDRINILCDMFSLQGICIRFIPRQSTDALIGTI